MENYRQPTFLRRKMVPQRDTTKMFAKILRFVAESLEIKGKKRQTKAGTRWRKMQSEIQFLLQPCEKSTSRRARS